MSTCLVTIHGSSDHGQLEYRGRPMFRAYAERCTQAGPWRFDTTMAEIDARTMDGHDCPHVEPGKEMWERYVPRDRLVTKRDALFMPDSALRYHYRKR